MSRQSWILGVFVALALIVGLYRAKYGADEAAQKIDRLEREILAVQEEISLLEKEYAHLSRLDWVAAYARNELGMRPPRADQVRSLSDVLRTPIEPVGEEVRND